MATKPWVFPGQTPSIARSRIPQLGGGGILLNQISSGFTATYDDARHATPQTHLWQAEEQLMEVPVPQTAHGKPDYAAGRLSRCSRNSKPPSTSGSSSGLRLLLSQFPAASAAQHPTCNLRQPFSSKPQFPARSATFGSPPLPPPADARGPVRPPPAAARPAARSMPPPVRCSM